MQKGETQDTPWAEQNKSIVGQNRFRLLCTVALVRILENMFVCFILPRTSYACRAIGHCPEGVPMGQLSKIFSPGGIASYLRSDNVAVTSSQRAGISGIFLSTAKMSSATNTMTGRGKIRDNGIISTIFSTILSFVLSIFKTIIHPDRLTNIMIFASVLLISLVLLLVQAATLDRSYLAIMGYIAGEWTMVPHNNIGSTVNNDKNGNSSNSSAGASSSFGNVASNSSNDDNDNDNSAIGQWDPRRRYKKGDVIIQHNYTSIGRGIINSGLSALGPLSSLISSSSTSSSTTSVGGGPSGGGGGIIGLGNMIGGIGDGTLYKATSNSPEGRPFDLFLRATHDLFRNELGPVSTSKLIVKAIQAHILFIFVLSVLILWNIVLGYYHHPTNSNALMTTLLANLVSCYGSINVGLTPHKKEFSALAKQLK